MKGYKEFGDVICVQDLEAEEKIFSAWFDGYYWASILMLRAQASQPCELIVQRRGRDRTPSIEYTAMVIEAPTAEGYRDELDFEIAVGASFRVGVKNTGTEPGDFNVSLTLRE